MHKHDDSGTALFSLLSYIIAAFTSGVDVADRQCTRAYRKLSVPVTLAYIQKHVRFRCHTRSSMFKFDIVKKFLQAGSYS